MGLVGVFRCVYVLIPRRLQVRIMVLKTLHQVLNTDRPRGLASPVVASPWWRSDQRPTDHNPEVALLSAALRPTELEVLLCVRRAVPPSLPPSLPPTRPSFSLPFTTVVLCTPRCGVTVHSTLPLACRRPWPSMGVRWEYLSNWTPMTRLLVIFWLKIVN